MHHLQHLLQFWRLLVLSCLLCVTSAGCASWTASHTRRVAFDQDTVWIGQGRMVDGRKEGPWVFRAQRKGPIVARGSYAQNMKTGRWTFWYPNGTKRMEGIYERGAKRGIWSVWFEQGTLKSRGLYVMGSRQGLWEAWDQAGNKRSQGWYKKGSRTGVWLRWDAQGRRQQRGAYDNNLPTGLWTFWYPNGEMSHRGRFAKGRRTMQWSYWHDNGQLAWRGRFVKGQPDGVWRFWYPNGVTWAMGRYYRGMQRGNWIYYHDNATIASQGRYAQDRATGKWQFFDPQGIRRAEVPFRSGRVKGIVNAWYANGKQLVEARVHYDLLRSLTTVYHDNGQKALQAQFHRGYPFGPWELWYDSGQEKSFIHMYQGRPYRQRTDWDRQGKKTTRATAGELFPAPNTQDTYFKQWYDACRQKTTSAAFAPIAKQKQHYKGNRTGYWQWFYPKSRQPFAKGSFYKGAASKSWRFFHESSTRACAHGSFVRGVPHGKWFNHRPDGQVQAMVSYHYGTVHGPQVTYYTPSRTYQGGIKLFGQRFGMWITYGYNRQPRRRQFYIADKLIFDLPRPDTRLIVKRTLRQGDSLYLAEGPLYKAEPHGLWQLSHPKSGRPQGQGAYLTGLRHGTWSFLFEDGSPRMMGQYRRGLRRDVWLFWHPNGAIHQRGYYNAMGQKDGTWSIWAPDGKRIGKKMF